MHKLINDEAEMLAFAAEIAKTLSVPHVIFLHGDLGAGKTTFTRGLLQALGHKGNVKSPTFTLVEPYQLEGLNVYHFDLYRIADPDELELIGIRDYVSDNAICIFEWPEKAEGLLPKPDVDLYIDIEGTKRSVNVVNNTTIR